VHIFTKKSAYIAWRTGLTDHAFVPTMGALHDGHLALVRSARADHQAVSASIFVNPKQFGPREDLARYPRPREHDVQMLKDAGVAAVFAPGDGEMYPSGFSTEVHVTGPLTERFEGAVRPGHFVGVATVVAKLLLIARPTVAYFGQKDAQQVLVVMRMVADLDLACRIAVVPTQREPDGLAMSSRNVYLTPDDRLVAPSLFAALNRINHAYRDGERRAGMLEQVGHAYLRTQPPVQLEYLNVVSPMDLAELEVVHEGALAVVAARIGGTRLIDNILIGDVVLGARAHNEPSEHT